MGDDQEDTQMLVNMVKVKDEEIKQLKRQLGVTELNASPTRSNASPLRQSKHGSATKHSGLKPVSLDGNGSLEA